MNRNYRIMTATAIEPKQEVIENKVQNFDFKSVLTIRKGDGEFIFYGLENIDKLNAKDENDAKLIQFVKDFNAFVKASATGGKMTIETMKKSGEKVNRFTLKYDGGTLYCRTYGANKNVLPEREYSADEVKSLSFGICKRESGALVSTDVVSANSCEETPEFYVKVL